jgi:hypothetical protein
MARLKMSPSGLGLLALGALSLSSTALVSAQKNYTQEDMLRAQLMLLTGRPDDCPPW